MSYLEMLSAPLPDMNQGIISIWFRDATKGPLPPAEDWPSGNFWDDPDSMVPPDALAYAREHPNANEVFYWNANGLPIAAGGISLPLFGPPLMYMPSPPPLALSKMRTLLTFGDPDQKIQYYSWKIDDPGVLPAVELISSMGFVVIPGPPPYGTLYNHHVGDNGLFYVKNFQIEETPTEKANMVPQSFIGVDKDGYLTICLQTNTYADYSGYAIRLKNIKEMWAARSFLEVDGPPYSYTELAFPFPDGHWYQVPGYWNGYQFEWEDMSNKIMAASPECFIIGGPYGVIPDIVPGPKIDGKGWHHLLFSFDISGAVKAVQTAKQAPGAGDIETETQNVEMSTGCKAWVAVDDVNYQGAHLQKRFAYPDGFWSPLLPGMGQAGILPVGVVTTYPRSAFLGPLGPNDIIPQNLWLHGFTGYPRDGIQAAQSNTPINEVGSAYTPAGYYEGLDWAGALWPLYGHGIAPGPWYPILDPPKPPPDPKKTFTLPTYDCHTYNIPVQGHPIGIPASTHHVDHNTGIEMAELQIWANKTLDTGDEVMRRLFIDDKGKPVSPSVAAKVLGKPDILLHGRSNWKKGYNTGQTGQRLDGTKIPVGQFVPTAKIEAFKPEPKLGK